MPDPLPPRAARRAKALRLLAPALLYLCPDAEMVQLLDGDGRPLGEPHRLVVRRARPSDEDDDAGPSAARGTAAPAAGATPDDTAAQLEAAARRLGGGTRDAICAAARLPHNQYTDKLFRRLERAGRLTPAARRVPGRPVVYRVA
jgi:hypothetical protein